MFKQQEFNAYFDDFVREACQQPVQELIFGTTGYATNGNIRLYYEMQSPKKEVKSTVLLISRNANTLLFWPQSFIQSFLDAGYRVVRFDHRGIGMSDLVLDWTKKTAFTLEDMAGDAMAVLNALNIDKAHIIGASMGGMIAQRFAYLFPNATLSLCSIMSSGYFFDPEFKGLNKAIQKRLRSVFIGFLSAKNDFRKQIKMHLAERQLWVGKGLYSLDLKRFFNEVSYEIKHRNGYHRKSFEKHVSAIRKSGSMLKKLKEIHVPTLIIHGEDDALIPIEHAKKYVDCLKDVKSYYLSGMGHDFQYPYLTPISNRILDFYLTSGNQ